jgi:hypothetical protein
MSNLLFCPICWKSKIGIVSGSERHCQLACVLVKLLAIARYTDVFPEKLIVEF